MADEHVIKLEFSDDEPSRGGTEEGTPRLNESMEKLTDSIHDLNRNLVRPEPATSQERPRSSRERTNEEIGRVIRRINRRPPIPWDTTSSDPVRRQEPAEELPRPTRPPTPTTPPTPVTEAPRPPPSDTGDGGGSDGGDGGDIPPTIPPPRGGGGPPTAVPRIIPVIAGALLIDRALRSTSRRVQDFGRSIEEAAQGVIGFSEEVTEATVEARLRQLGATMQRAERIGENLGSMVKDMSRVSIAVQGIQNELIKFFTNDFKIIASTLIAILRLLESILWVINQIRDWIRFFIFDSFIVWMKKLIEAVTGLKLGEDDEPSILQSELDAFFKRPGRRGGEEEDPRP